MTNQNQTYRERFIAMYKRFMGDCHEVACKPLSKIAPEVLEMKFAVERIDTVNGSHGYHQARQRPAKVVVTVGDTTFTLREIVLCQTP